MSSEVPAHFWRWIKNLPFLALQAQAPAETQGSPSEPAAARHRRCGDSRSSSPRQTPPFMGLSRKQDRVSETCSLRSPPDPTSRTQTLRTGVFFTNSLYFLDRVPQQLFLLYQPHVISWDEFFWFLNTDYLHLDGNDRVLAETPSRQQERGEPLPGFVCATAESVQQPQIPPPHKHRCRWP